MYFKNLISFYNEKTGKFFLEKSTNKRPKQVNVFKTKIC